jgi:S-DNA-T family DNA segregation ATPase FtsK/SpoIIIE
VHRQGYSNRAAARSAVRNATVRRSFQCPDANILPGQIKNNMNIRICGRADTTLSTIIIGDGRAAEQIPHDAQGRFLMEDGTVFQAYYFNDDTISKW